MVEAQFASLEASMVEGGANEPTGPLVVEPTESQRFQDEEDLLEPPGETRSGSFRQYMPFKPLRVVKFEVSTTDWFIFLN